MPRFPTLPFPNPEEPGALDLAAALAGRVGADLVMANDPDADRLGAMVPALDGSGRFVALTGNEIGAVLAQHRLASTEGDDRLVVTTVVSSQLLARQAEAASVHHAEVPTGFKWVVRPGLDHPEWRFVFGYEEALGYSVDAFVRDKDGISAAVCLAQVVAAARADGASVWDRLEALARQFGEHVTRTVSWRVDGVDGPARLAAAMAALRSTPPSAIGGVGVDAVTDLARAVEGRPAVDVVVVGLADGSRLALRPSGTEPKLKLYVEVVQPVAAGPGAYAQARARGAERVETLVAAMAAHLGLDATAG